MSADCFDRLRKAEAGRVCLLDPRKTGFSDDGEQLMYRQKSFQRSPFNRTTSISEQAELLPNSGCAHIACSLIKQPRSANFLAYSRGMRLRSSDCICVMSWVGASPPQNVHSLDADMVTVVGYVRKVDRHSTTAVADAVGNRMMRS